MTATPSTDVRDRCADVLSAMVLGCYGDRARGYAREQVGAAWTERRLDDAPRVLARIVDQFRVHMHPTHVGALVERIVLDLVDPTFEPTVLPGD